MTRFLVVKGPDRGTSLKVVDGATIGRDKECAIRVNGDRISRTHARIEKQGKSFLILDEGSRNGILVNGRKVSRHTLKPDDEVQLGDVALVYEPSFDLKIEGTFGVDDGPDTTIRETIDGSVTFDDLVREDQAEQAHRRLNVILEIAQLLNTVNDDAEMAERMLDRLVETVGAERGFIMLYDERRKLVPAAVRKSSGDHEQFYVSNTLLHRVIEEKRAAIAYSKGRSILATPLILRDAPFGFVYVDSPEEDRFTPHDLRFIATVSAFAAAAVENARRFGKASKELSQARQRLAESGRIIGESRRITELREKIAACAPGEATVLVIGETGTGKELVARAIHAASPRCAGPFQAVNCAALSGDLLEAELFGYEKGAFTGAENTRVGLFESAEGGTLFLDEVGELRPELQAKFLRTLEERSLTRIGSHETRPFDVRIIAATSHDLENVVRKDLYYRLAVVSLHLPPLRERKTDIRLLVEHFLESIDGRVGGLDEHMEPEVVKALESPAWPGNLRELRNTVEQMVIAAAGARIRLTHLPPAFAAGEKMTPGRLSAELPLPKLVADLERRCVEEALKRTTSRSAAAELLGISRPTLYKKIEEYGLE